MKVNLLPVLEIQYSDQDLATPENYPYWENSEIWEVYNKACLKKAGFPESLTPYLRGSSFYKLSDISDNNLSQLIIKHTQDLRDGKYQRKEVSTFSGGYVLQVDGLDKYFPQCCGELSDIIYWDRLSKGESSSSEGHPGPEVKFNEEKISLDFTIGEFDEQFQPTPSERILFIERRPLKLAVEEARAELIQFQKRLEAINENQELNISNIGGLLIWDNENYV